MTNELRFLIDTVKKANSLINTGMIVKPKGESGDLVTNFDLEIEKFIIKKIKENYPNFDIVSEEYNTNNCLTDNCFTIDPIDGTINFANNIPLWGIQVACIKNGETVAAVIYLPKYEELYYADKNGAFLNGTPISVNNLGINNGVYTIAGAQRYLKQKNMANVSIHYRDFYSAAVNFAWTACGRLSAVYFGYNSAWDYVPGMYLVKQAGGVVYDDENLHIAANSQEFLELLKEKCKK